MAWRRIGMTGVACSLAIAVVGCFGGTQETDPVSQDSGTAEVAALVERYEAALRAKDAQTVCRELLARRTIRDVFTDDRRCQRRLQAAMDAGGGFADEPSLEIESVDFDGKYARANLTDGGFLDLVRERGRWHLQLSF